MVKDTHGFTLNIFKSDINYCKKYGWIRSFEMAHNFNNCRYNSAHRIRYVGN